ncbi:RF-1 domain-containing protein [Xylariaceae sp. FL0255]|nr:RF-1 domain-containing protein [Xylariaceae sp. FL0255]
MTPSATLPSFTTIRTRLLLLQNNAFKSSRPRPRPRPTLSKTLTTTTPTPFSLSQPQSQTPPSRLPNSKNLPPRPKPPPESEIEESFLKGSGPGGQKINKTNSAVQLKHIPTGIVVKSQATRSRSQNRNIARQLLADKLDDIARGTESRSNVVGAVKSKKKASSAKKSRRKYRKLEAQKEVTAEEEDGHEIEEHSETELPHTGDNSIPGAADLKIRQ